MKIHFSILALIIAIGLINEYNFVYYKQRNKNYIMSLWPWLVVFGYITFLAAMRSGMNDTPGYIQSFEQCEGTFQAAVEAFTSADIKYKFTMILENLFKAYVSKDYHMWFLFIASIQSVCFVYVYRREAYGFLIPCFFSLPVLYIIIIFRCFGSGRQ